MSCQKASSIKTEPIRNASTVCGPWSGRKRRERVFLSLEKEQRAEICPVSYRVIQLTCEKTTASQCLLDYSVISKTVVRFDGPWSGQRVLGPDSTQNLRNNCLKSNLKKVLAHF